MFSNAKRMLVYLLIAGVSVFAIACGDDNGEGGNNGGGSGVDGDTQMDVSADASTRDDASEREIDADADDQGDSRAVTCSENEYECAHGCCLWAPETVGTASGLAYLSLAMLGDQIVVAYLEDEQIKIARKAAQSWEAEEIETVQPPQQISSVVFDDEGRVHLGLVRNWDEAASGPPYWRLQIYSLSESTSDWSERRVGEDDYSAAMVWMIRGADGLPVLTSAVREQQNSTNSFPTYISTMGPDGSLDWSYRSGGAISPGFSTPIWNQYGAAVDSNGEYHFVLSDDYWSSIAGLMSLPENFSDVAIDSDDRGGVHFIGRSSDVLTHLVREPDGTWTSEELVETSSDRASTFHISAHSRQQLAYCYIQREYPDRIVRAGYRSAQGWFHLPAQTITDGYTDCDVAHDDEGNAYLVHYIEADGTVVFGLMGQPAPQ